MIALPVLLLLSATQAEPPPTPTAPAVAAPTTWDLGPESTIAAHVVHKLHSVDAVTRDVEGRARLSTDGRLVVVVRAKVTTFDSGNANRDAHMLEVLDAARFPWVMVRGEASDVRPVPSPEPVEVRLQGVLDFHGSERPLDVTARVRFVTPERAEVEAAFPVSLDAYDVERPSLFFIKIGDRITITAHLRFAAAGG